MLLLRLHDASMLVKDEHIAVDLMCDTISSDDALDEVVVISLAQTLFSLHLLLLNLPKLSDLWFSSPSLLKLNLSQPLQSLCPHVSLMGISPLTIQLMMHVSSKQWN